MKAALVTSVPITSLVREVAVLSMLEIPSPCKKERGYTIILPKSSSDRNINGNDPIEVTAVAIKSGYRRFLEFSLMFSCQKTDISMEAT